MIISEAGARRVLLEGAASAKAAGADAAWEQRIKRFSGNEPGGCGA
jgi:hypothetical protein